jgi:hypothetical protein
MNKPLIARDFPRFIPIRKKEESEPIVIQVPGLMLSSVYPCLHMDSGNSAARNDFTTLRTNLRASEYWLGLRTRSLIL